MILPTPTDVTQLLQRIGDRYALDFAGLPDSLTDGPNWFRTLTEPGGAVWFEQFTTRQHLVEFFGACDAAGSVPERGGKDWVNDLDWCGLASEVLPHRLQSLLSAAVDEPLELVVSAHKELTLLPWAALKLAGGTRLVRRAVLTQTPVLTCLSGTNPPRVSGPALVRLVSRAEYGDGGVWTKREQQAWGLAPRDGVVPLCESTLDGEAPRLADHDRISAALKDATAGVRFLHIAAHGAGGGLAQYLALPEENATGGRLSAAHALALYWPESTLMASCRVGQVANVEHAEPLGFVMAVLTGGGRCAVAAIDSVPDAPAGRMAAQLVSLIRRSGGIRLDHALRLAQLRQEEGGEPVRSWALFNAYVR